MSERLYVTDAWLEDFAKSDLSHMRDLARELIERRAADQANADQARHWQREAERVKQVLGGQLANLTIEHEEAHLAIETLRHELANAEQAAMLSDEDHAALEWLRNIDWDWPPSMKDMTDQAIDALDRLLSRGKDGR